MSDGKSPEQHRLQDTSNDTDIQAMMERMFISDPSIQSLTWTRTVNSESVTLTRTSRHRDANSLRPRELYSVPAPDTPVTSPSSPIRVRSPPLQLPDSVGPSRHPQVNSPACRTYVPVVPSPSDIHPPLQPVAKYYVITVGEEVGIFYDWNDVAERVNFVPGNRHKSYKTFEDALAAYTRKFDEGSVHVVRR